MNFKTHQKSKFLNTNYRFSASFHKKAIAKSKGHVFYDSCPNLTICFYATSISHEAEIFRSNVDFASWKCAHFTLFCWFVTTFGDFTSKNCRYFIIFLLVKSFVHKLSRRIHPKSAPHNNSARPSLPHHSQHLGSCLPLARSQSSSGRGLSCIRSINSLQVEEKWRNSIERALSIDKNLQKTSLDTPQSAQKQWRTSCFLLTS